ncbi:MAG: amidohydrolase family protein [Planctomycetes bacterium]|nr:amidohydrolase family protein [Planctomycetota bacterium]
MNRCCPTVLILLALAHGAAAQSDRPALVVLKGARIHPVASAPIDGGVLILAGGKVQALGGADLPVPEGAKVIDCTGKVITPGLVDAGANVAIQPRDRNEQGDEVTPQARIVDAMDPLARSLERVLRQGVTTVQVNPGTRNVIGGTGAVLRTHAASAAEMVLKDKSQLRIVLGAEPSQGNMAIRGGNPDSIYYRRPTTRMGVVWTIRKAFYDAQAYREKRTIPANGAPMPELDAGMEVLLEALDRKLTVRSTARAEQDIRTALRLAEEFGYETVLDESAEVWRVIDLVAGAKAKVLFNLPSAARARDGAAADGAEVRLNTLELLAKAKVPFAIQGSGAGLPLIQEAAFAVRQGLDAETALAAITKVPAEVLGVADRVGTLAPGRDADVVVWSGDPFDPATRIESVFVQGRQVVN